MIENKDNPRQDFVAARRDSTRSRCARLWPEAAASPASPPRG